MKNSSPILDVIVLILLDGSLLAGLLFVNGIDVRNDLIGKSLYYEERNMRIYHVVESWR